MRLGRPVVIAALCAPSACGLGVSGLLDAPATEQLADAGVTPSGDAVAESSTRPEGGWHAGGKDGAPPEAGDDAPPPPGDAAADSPADVVQPITCEGGAPLNPGGAVVFGAPVDQSPVYGGGGNAHPGANAFDDTCPAGSALVGLTLASSSGGPQSIAALRGLCAPIALGPCSVEIGPSTELPDHGAMSSAGGTTLACPPGSVVIGLAARAGSFIDSIAIDCGELTFDAADAGAFVVGAPSPVGPYGGPGGAQRGPWDCPSPSAPSSVVTEISGSWGNWIDTFQIHCAQPALQ
jgi:hypothetical protein